MGLAHYLRKVFVDMGRRGMVRLGAVCAAVGGAIGTVAHAMAVDWASSVILGALIASSMFAVSLFLSHKAMTEIKEELKSNSARLGAMERSLDGVNGKLDAVNEQLRSLDRLDTMESLLRDIRNEFREMRLEMRMMREEMGRAGAHRPGGT